MGIARSWILVLALRSLAPLANAADAQARWVSLPAKLLPPETPFSGCDLGAGDWPTLQAKIKRIAVGTPITVVATMKGCGWVSVETEQGHGFMKATDLSPTPVQPLDQRPTVARLFAAGAEVALFSVESEPGDHPSLTVPSGAPIESLGPIEPRHPWHFVRTADRKFWKTNVSQFTAEEFDSERAQEAWKLQLKAQEAKIAELPNYKDIVKAPRKFANRLFKIQLLVPSSQSNDFFEASLLEKAKGTGSFVVEDDTLGHFTVETPFPDLHTRGQWAKSWQLLVRVHRILHDPTNLNEPDKHPALRAVAAFDGVALYVDNPQRCDRFFELAGRRLVTMHAEALECVEAGERDCSSPDENYKEYSSFAHACANVYLGQPGAKQHRAMSRAVKDGEESLSSIQKALAFQKDTFKYAEQMKAAKKASAHSVATLRKLFKINGSAGPTF